MQLIAGVDDSGRGPVIGPLVVSGILLGEEQLPLLQKLGVRDSKLIPFKRREKLAMKLKEIAIKIAYVELNPAEIDEVVLTGGKLRKLNFLEARAMAKVIERLSPDVAYVDAVDVKPDRFATQIKELLPFEVKIISEHKADNRYPIVSAASILSKVKRDEIIADLHRKYGDFGSLPFEEKVLVEDPAGNLLFAKIGKLVETYKNKSKELYAFAFDPATLKIRKFPITGYIKHHPQPLYKLKLEYGMEVVTTYNHCVFTLNGDGDVVATSVGSLKRGDYVCIAGCLPSSGTLCKLNFAELLSNASHNNREIYLHGQSIRMIFEREAFEDIESISKREGYNHTTVYDWSHKNMLPLHIVSLINREYLQAFFLEKYESYIRIRDGVFPAIFPLREDFMWLLGLYVAKGYLKDKCNVAIVNKNADIIKKVQAIAKELGISSRVNVKNGEVWLNSRLMVEFIRSLNIGENASEKCIPAFVFQTQNNLMNAFLEGYLAGDGFPQTNPVNAEISSSVLAEQLWLLLLLNGRVASQGNHRNRALYSIHILSRGTNSLSPDNLPCAIGLILRKAREHAGLSQRKLAKLSGISGHVIYTIENGRQGRILRRTLNKAIVALKRLSSDNLYLSKLEKLANSDLCWAKVLTIEDVGRTEVVYDLEVRPNGRPVENFIGGFGGVVLHNSGYPHDPKTRRFLFNWIRKHGSYPDFVRKSWKTAIRLKEEAQRIRL